MTKEEFLKLPQYLLNRVYLPTETLGSIYDSRGGLICKTMELPWKDNKRAISCIPENEYLVIYQPPKAGREYEYFRLPEVNNRSGILIHRITYVKDLKGCIGVGGKHVDLNKDGVPDMVESSKTLQEMIDTMPKQFRLLIESKSGTPYK
jgi:hypothetical protein